MKYTFAELVEIYRRYAALKGWYTNDDAVREHVLDHSSGLLKSAIAFHETGKDDEKDSGFDAEAVAANSPIVLRVTKITASKYRNRDGTDRQTLLASCQVPEFLVLKRAVYDSGERNVIAVLRQDGSRLGYLSKTVWQTFGASLRKDGLLLACSKSWCRRDRSPVMKGLAGT